MPAGPEALQIFSDNLLQHMPIEREIRDQPLQLGAFFPQLPQLPQFTQPKPRILPLPHIERLLADAYLAADLRDGCSTLHVP